MASFDPKTKIERILLRYPSLNGFFREASPIVDDQLTVEEFCFSNSLSFMDFYPRLDAAIKEAESREVQAREEAESRIATASHIIAKKEETRATAAMQGEANPIVVGVLLLSALLYAAATVSHLLPDVEWLRRVLFIHSSIAFPHVPQMLSLMNFAALSGVVLLLLRRKEGIMPLLAGAMINDVFVLTLTDGFPYATLLAAVAVCLMLTMRVSGRSFRDLLH